MKPKKTASEEAFEGFLTENEIRFERIKEASSPRPDYCVLLPNSTVMFEVKELAEDRDFHGTWGERLVGQHIRNRIKDKRVRAQANFAYDQGIPSVLLIYNNLDHAHIFGTADHDFTTAMYGAYSLPIDNESGRGSVSIREQHQSIRDKPISAVGRLSPLGGNKVTLFENAYAKVVVPYEQLPACFEALRFQIEPVNPGPNPAIEHR